MMDTEKHCRAAVLAAAFCLLLAGCGDKLETPEAYAIGEDSTITLDSFFADEEESKEDEDEEEDAEEDAGTGGKLVGIEAPDDKKDKDEEDEESEDEESEEAEEIYTYSYEEVAGETLTAFAEALTGEDEGFAVVDDELKPLAELPDMAAAEGSATFARASVEEGMVFQLAVTWAEDGTCTVVVSRPEGELGEASEPEEKEKRTVLTLPETVDYVRALSPSVLGLEGESMSEYILIPEEGSPLVDGEMCRHLDVYQMNEKTHTNEVRGSYLVGIGKIYKLDEETRTVTLLN